LVFFLLHKNTLTVFLGLDNLREYIIKNYSLFIFYAIINGEAI